jgi:hypothetical protein
MNVMAYDSYGQSIEVAALGSRSPVERESGCPQPDVTVYHKSTYLYTDVAYHLPSSGHVTGGTSSYICRNAIRRWRS